jgi:hypothetical protein
MSASAISKMPRLASKFGHLLARQFSPSNQSADTQYSHFETSSPGFASSEGASTSSHVPIVHMHAGTSLHGKANRVVS